MNVSAILFDLDGVLVDSIAGVELVWRDWATAHGFDADAVVAVVHGRRAADTVAAVAPHLDVATELAALTAREASDTRGIQPIDGAAAFVSALPPQAWAVVTSGMRAAATFRLGVGGVPVPKVLVSAEDVERGKPDPSCYLLGAQRLGVAPSECLVIEDAPAGLAAAKAAGMRSIGVTTTYDVAALQDATVVVRSVADLVVRVDPVTSKLEVSVREGVTPLRG